MPIRHDGPAHGREILLLLNADGTIADAWLTWYNASGSATCARQMPVQSANLILLFEKLCGEPSPQLQLF